MLYDTPSKEKKAVFLQNINRALQQDTASNFQQIKKYFPLLVEEYRRELSSKNCYLLHQQKRWDQLYDITKGLRKVIGELQQHKRPRIKMHEYALFMFFASWVSQNAIHYMYLPLEEVLIGGILNGAVLLALLILIYIIEEYLMPQIP